MALNRSSDGSDPLRGERVADVGGARERRTGRSTRLGEGTLACPECDAPVALPQSRPVTPADAIGCPFCGHDAAVRDFLSMRAPTRPTRVVVRVVVPGDGVRVEPS